MNNPIDAFDKYLDTLAWDGVTRLGNWTQTYLGTAEDPEAAKRVRKWLISAVARVKQPGCRADGVLVLVGPGGCGKSRALHELAPSTTFCGPDVVTSNVIVEIDADSIMYMSESETAQLKAFFAATTDTYRPPYAKTPKVTPRRCVFAVTCNDELEAPELELSRRLWVVRVTKLDHDALVRDRDQIWAEAVHAYRAGESWWVG